MIDLTSTTFIIPLRIEHQDRYNNALTTLSFLNKCIKTNVFINEVSEDRRSKLDFLNDLKHLSITHWVGQYQDVFHRTKYLNQMLNEVKTPVVVNYDIDVLLEPSTYNTCQNLIMKGEADVMYPYQWGEFQKQVSVDCDKSILLREMNLDAIPDSCIKVNYSESGHCVFFNTSVYRNNGGENENFISWGPEDKERVDRFQKLEYSVKWLSGSYVYHLEHRRGSDSSEEHGYFKSNWDLYGTLKEMPKEEVLSYYSNQQYIKQYDNFLHTK